MYGKTLRMAKLMPLEHQKLCVVPLDHGVTLGAIHGIENAYKAVSKINQGGADAVVIHKGILRMISQYPELAPQNYIMHLSASTDLGMYEKEKVLVGSVEEAIKLGAIGISMHVNFGTSSEREMISSLGRISEKCMDWGMPLLVMTYVQNDSYNSKTIAHAARTVQELGADIIKINLPSTNESIEEILSGINVPLIVAGGQTTDNTRSFLSKLYYATKYGASGVAIGRNIFGSENVVLMTRIIKCLINDKLSLEQCLDELKK